jgi:hypothetical protein
LSVEQAAEASGIDIGEARMHAADDDKNPPPAAAYELLYDPDARAAASANKEPVMAKNDGDAEEVKKPDAKKAFDIYDKQIKPKLAVIDTKRGECSQPWSDIKEHANYPRPVMNFLLALERIDDEAKQQHYLLALSEGLQERGLKLEVDLVMKAQGKNDAPIVPAEQPAADDGLVTLGDDDGAAAPGDKPDDLPFEASEDELARQSGRRVRDSQDEADAQAMQSADGTGAAARAAMKAADTPTPAPAPAGRRRAGRPKAGGHLAAVH